MTSVTFLLSKHPYARDDGETVVSRLLLEAAAEAFTVRAIALGEALAAPVPVPIEVVPKAPLSLARVVPAALRRGRSAIHERFAPPELVAAVRRAGDTRLVARRLYMAEAALDAGRRGPGAPDAIVDVLESEVLRRRGGALAPLLGFEAQRTAADERRCLRACASLARLGDDERAPVRAAVGHETPRLDLALPPHGDGAPSDAPGPVALFLGDRRGSHPNRAGLRRLYAMWPAIRAAVPGAELVVAGLPAPREPGPPSGARAVGHVGDLEPVWTATRVLLAPVPVGGGVRVKLLEAASRGVPVVAAAAAVGSIGAYLPIAPAADDASFVAEAVRLLRDAPAARRASAELWEANARHRREHPLAGQLERWLEPPVPPPVEGLGADHDGCYGPDPAAVRPPPAS